MEHRSVGSNVSGGSGGRGISGKTKPRRKNRDEVRKERGDRRKPKKTKPMVEQRFTNYFQFGFETTVCLGGFVLCYALVLLTLWPLLLAPTPEENIRPSHANAPHHDHRLHVPAALKKAHVPGQEKISAMAGTVKKKLQQLRQGRGVTDAALFEQAQQEFAMRKKEKALRQQNSDESLRGAVEVKDDHLEPGQRQGFVVLGMHRSGTSMLSGLLHTSSGYEVGGPLIGSAFDNEKGFFERVDVVLQNDEFMKHQRVWWSSNVIAYDWERALKMKESGDLDFHHGKTALAFLNNPNKAPWLQKDPRMCITLKTWLKLLNNEPAVLFTYRHPLEVAMSLKRREQDFPLEKGLRLWIVYNMRAIQNSKGLCMVHSSNDAILANPLEEVQRISDELTTKCNVVEPPNRLSQEDIDKFIDPSLQHNKKDRAAGEKDKEVIATYNDGKCQVLSYDSEEEEGSDSFQREKKLYGFAMKIYCDFQSGKAYEDDYEWPKLV